MSKNFLIFIVLSLVFAGLFLVGKDDAGMQHAVYVETIPSVQMFGGSSEVAENISKFGAAFGAVLGLIAFILSAIVFGILRIVRIPSKISAGISNLLVYGGVAGLGYELAYLEEKNSLLASAVVHYASRPLLYAGAISAILAIIFFIASFMKKEDIKAVGEKAPMVLFIIFSSLFLSGCSLLGNVTEIGCNFSGGGKNAAHCYQEAAIQQNDERVCDKAPQGEEFKKAGSNPPKDKCHYSVAQNKRDPKICDNIKGGMLSYDPVECKTKVLDSAEKEIKTKLDSSNGGKNLSSEELSKMQKQIEEYNKMLEMMTNVTKATHEMNMSLIKGFRQ